jgi:hypothetical protein
VSPEDVFDLDSDPQVMATITQTGEELLLPNLSLGRKAAQVGLGRFGVKSLAAQGLKGLA